MMLYSYCINFTIARAFKIRHDRARFHNGIKGESMSLPPNYKPSETEPYMNPQQVEYFREKLLKWREGPSKRNGGDLASYAKRNP